MAVVTQGQAAASDFPILASAARTATATSSFFVNRGNARGVRIYVEVTDSAATPSVLFALQVWDKRADAYHTLLTSAAVTGAGVTFYEVYPGGATTANVRATNHIGKGFRVLATHSDADSITYSVSGEWLP